MDPIAHTLAGATLAQTGLKKLTPLATTTLVIAANLPDIDAMATVLGMDASLYYRRGITHGIAALVVLPFLLSLSIMAYDRFIRQQSKTPKEKVKFGGLLLLSYIGVLSHPFLDWLNTYGVRLLMPFDGRWFYGDTLFIIDPWVWLLMASSVIFAHSQARLSKSLWILVGVMASLLITLTTLVPITAKLVWWLGIAIIVVLRVRGVEPSKNRWLAVACLASLGVYLFILAAGNNSAQQKVQNWIEQEMGLVVTDLMTGPVPANPFYREVLAVTDSHYYGVRVQVIGRNEMELIFDPVKIESPNTIVAAALEMNEVRGFVNWMRFPTYEVRSEKDGFLVIIRDLRFVRPDQEPGPGIGIAEVFVNSRQIQHKVPE